MITLTEYCEQWPEMFITEKTRIIAAAGNFMCGAIEHVGSTAVEGLMAKPVIDIMFGVSSLVESTGAIDALQSIGYCYAPYKAEQMHWFCKPTPEIRTHHLHLIPYNGKLWQQRIAFRNKLREDKVLSIAYQQLKIELAAEFGHDRERYTQQKTAFIEDALEQMNLPSR